MGLTPPTSSSPPLTVASPPKRPSQDGTPSSDSPKRPPRRHPRLIHSGDVWVILVVVVMLILFYTGLIRPLVSYLYSPFAFVLIVVMCLEFLFLKSRDRSRFYRMEIQMMRNRRREDIRLLRETSEHLEKVRRDLRALRSRVQDDGRMDAKTRERLSEVEEQMRGIEDEVKRIHEEITGR